MTQAERVLAHLRAIAPQGAGSRELLDVLGLRWHASVYRATRKLLAQGAVRGERRGRAWVFFALPGQDAAPPQDVPAVAAEATKEEAITVLPAAPARPAVFQPQECLTWRLNRSARSWQARYIVPLLAQPEGRAWFVRRLGSTCPPEAAATGEVWHFTYPLRDLFLADLASVRGQREAEEGFIAYYNDLFGLPADCGIAEVWRKTPGGPLRCPTEGKDGGWSDRILEAKLHDRRLRRRARNARRLMEAEADVLLITERYLVLVLCLLGEPLTERRFKEQRRLAGALEYRLRRQHYLAAVVEAPEQLGAASMPYLHWTDLV